MAAHAPKAVDVGAAIGWRAPLPSRMLPQGGMETRTMNGKTAVVTGASRGIGAAVARALHARGVNLGLVSRGGDDLGLIGVLAAPCDVRDADALKSFCDAAAARFGG